MAVGVTKGIGTLPRGASVTLDPGIIIVITKAEHLNENREFVSDIYDSVVKLDGYWSETIPSNHYVRVTFEANLTSSNDTTIFPRIISGSPRIEVYEFNKSEIIAEFTNISSNKYNQVFLTGLNGSQDVFDLKILNGSMEFDHIFDPDIVFPEINFINPTLANATTTGNTSVIINISIFEANLDEVKFNWNGSNFTIMNNSLVLMMNFNNVSALGENATYIVDVSGNGNNGTATNGAFFNSTGKYDGAYSFDGLNDYISISGGGGLNNLQTGSIGMWGKWIWRIDFTNRLFVCFVL